MYRIAEQNIKRKGVVCSDYQYLISKWRTKRPTIGWAK